LLDDLARRVEVDETLVNLEFVTVPSLRTFTTRCFASGDLEDLGRKTDGPLDTKLLVLGAVDEVCREFFQVSDVAAREGDTDLVDFSGGDCAGCVVCFLVLGDVTHFLLESEGD